MATFSKKSLDKLNSCHLDLQKLFLEVVKHYDCTILCGYRSQKDQEKALKEGNSKLGWPNSPHNKSPSLAVDVVPCPIDWNNTKAFYHFAGFVRATALQMGVNLIWGGDWDSDFDLIDQKFNDLPHFEIKA